MLIYSYGVVHLDTSFSKKNFWDGLESSVSVLSYKRIQTRQNENTQVDIKLVELKFLSFKLSNTIAIHKVILKVSPSIRSLVICRNCLRYSHTAKFCKDKIRCSFCGSQILYLNKLP